MGFGSKRNLMFLGFWLVDGLALINKYGPKLTEENLLCIYLDVLWRKISARHRWAARFH